ncbi:hypothetical protein LENED_006228 [Lentinula edodes]|uniref:Uncharacterized protein n=1 Tax=Lentinula edodes TaxID=5353 RepID=A0A1Q3EBD6_LENED|nr:hypothetical protein LENED_006228 [Lentinula edodes]
MLQPTIPTDAEDSLMLSNDSDDQVSHSSQSEDQKQLFDVPKAFYGDETRSKRLAAAPPVENVFVEKFSVVLPNKTVTFTMADISEFPKVKMPRSPQPYLEKLLSFWDDDLQTWDARICPLVGGTRIAAKHWKIIFSKAGHWKVSTNRTQWHTWRALIEELQRFDNCPEKLCKKYHNSTIRDIATASRK